MLNKASIRVLEATDTQVSGERVNEAIRGSKFTIEGNVIKQAFLVGVKSKNIKKGQKEPYKYNEAALKASIPMYENTDIVIGHTPDDKGYGERNPLDKVGFTSNVTLKEGVGLFGDITLNKEHASYETFMWWAAHKPEKLMLSHEAWCEFSDKTNEMTTINAVDCIAFVTKGGTTDGLFKEGLITDKIAKDFEERKVAYLLGTFSDISYEVRYPLGKTLTQEEQAVQLMPLIKDLLSEIGNMIPKQKESDSSKESVEEPETKVKTKEHTMEFADITLEALTKNRKDLVEAIESKAVESHIAIETAVVEALAQIPLEDQSEIFKTQIREAVVAGNDKLVSSLVADRKTLLAKKSTVESTLPETKKKGEKESEKVALTLESVVAQAVKRD